MSSVLLEGKLLSRLWSSPEMKGVSWHDTHVRGVFLDSGQGQLAFDIDFICEWIIPTDRKTMYSYLIAPATLVFPHATNIHMTLQAALPMCVFDVAVEQADVTRHDTRSELVTWLIDGPHGQLRLQSHAYLLYFRSEPIITTMQLLTLQERGGVSFDIPGGYNNTFDE